MLRLSFAALLSLALCALPTAAHADTLDEFTLTGNGRTLTFALPGTPTPDGGEDGLFFSLDPLPALDTEAIGVAPHALFYEGNGGGGFSFQSADFTEVYDVVNFFGPQLFTGSVAEPTFLLGDFQLTPIQCSSGDPNCGAVFNLNITTVTPEPSSLVLLGTGALGCAAALRRQHLT